MWWTLALVELQGRLLCNIGDMTILNECWPLWFKYDWFMIMFRELDIRSMDFDPKMDRLGAPAAGRPWKKNHGL